LGIALKVIMMINFVYLSLCTDISGCQFMFFFYGNPSPFPARSCTQDKKRIPKNTPKSQRFTNFPRKNTPHIKKLKIRTTTIMNNKYE